MQDGYANILEEVQHNVALKKIEITVTTRMAVTKVDVATRHGLHGATC